MSEGPRIPSTPEEEELERKRQERSDLEEELAQRELEVQTLNAELAEFRIEYLSTVGIKRAELDALQADILALKLERQFSAKRASTDARDTSAKPDLFDLFEKDDGNSVSNARMDDEVAKLRAEGKPVDFDEVFNRLLREKADSGRADELKRLYRQLAKLVHPDLAVDEPTRERRRRLMTEINEAYARSNLDRLKDLLQHWEVSPHNVEGEGAGADLIRMIREIAQVRKRLHSLAQEVSDLEQSELYRLRKRVDEARADRRDLLREMVEELEHEIGDARIRLDRLKEVSA